jgi:transposase-like protein
MRKPKAEDRRGFSPELKQTAVERMMAGAKPRQLAAELGIARKMLYRWKEAIEGFGEDAFPGQGQRRDLERGRPTHGTPEKAGAAALRQAERRIVELEREVGRQ